jgi:diacylglycerol kinase family enzyme
VSAAGGRSSSSASRHRVAARWRRLYALAALVLLVSSLAVMVYTVSQSLLQGLLVGALLVSASVAGWQALRRTGPTRTIFSALAVLLLVAAVVVMALGPVLAAAILAAVLLALAVLAGRRAFSVHVPLAHAEPPKRPVVVWNPRSGGGKAAAVRLDEEAGARGIEPIELRPGDDLVQLVEDAVARGADGLAAAGGDGTQAQVAAVAARNNLPFACIPAGTRNHFALDLGVDRTDVVGALDAFVNGGERRVDLAEVNGRVFVNNVSLGLYAQAVQRPEYRNHKIRTLVDTLPNVAGAAPSQGQDLRYDGPDGVAPGRTIVVQVSNNSYRLGRLVGSGTRPRIDDGRLGIAVLVEVTRRHRPHLALRRWEASTFEVDADGPVSAGVDGEALVLEPPLRFAIRSATLRVRVAAHHPGASPSAALPDRFVDIVRRLFHIVRTGDPTGTGHESTSRPARPVG